MDKRDDWPLSCDLCGDRIGVYEPIIAFAADGHSRTSLAREPVLWRGDVPLMHALCAVVWLSRGPA